MNGLETCRLAVLLSVKNSNVDNFISTRKIYFALGNYLPLENLH